MNQHVPGQVSVESLLFVWLSAEILKILAAIEKIKYVCLHPVEY